MTRAVRTAHYRPLNLADTTPARGGHTVLRMSDHTADDDAVTITVNLPLPVDVAATLTRAIGAIWPNTSIDMSDYSSRLSFQVTAADRLADDLDLDAVRHARVALRHDLEGDLTRIGDGQVGGQLPQEYTSYMAAMAEAFLDHYDADNYVEQTLTAPDGRRIIVTTQWANGNTPVEHRDGARAETARMQRLEAQLRERIENLEHELATAKCSS